MSEFREILGALFGFVFIAFWFATIFYGIRTTRHARPGISVWGRKTTLWNRFNVLWIPGLLTDKGKKYRLRCYLAIGGMIGSWYLAYYI